MLGKIPIYHMASFSRCGETLLLRCLNAHPDIHVVHQLREPETPEAFQLFRFLATFRPTEISVRHPLLKLVGVKPGQCLVLKNAVWTHKFPFNGFVLARNSLSAFNSFKIAGETEKAHDKRKLQFARWARDIDPEVLPAMVESDNVDCFCALYNRKLAPLAKLGLPIVRYEDFVQNPERILRALLKKLNLPWNDAVLKSHEQYEEGQCGHGHIPLWKPIHTDSLNSYLRHPRPLIAKIYGLTYPTMNSFGYSIIDGELQLSSDVPGLVS